MVKASAGSYPLSLPARFVVGAAFCLALALGGCSADSGPESTAGALPLVAAARDGGASEEQIALLGDGEVTFEEYQVAVGRTITCMRDAGIDVVGDSVTESRGFPEIHYSYAGSSVGRTDEQTLAIADECMSTHSRFVEAAYQMSPASLEAMDARFAPYRDTIIACVRENGGEVADDAAREKVLGAANDVVQDTGIDCVSEAGYTG